MKKVRLLAWLLSLVMLTTACPAFAEALEVELPAGEAVEAVLYLNTVLSTLIFSPFLIDYLIGRLKSRRRSVPKRGTPKRWQIR